MNRLYFISASALFLMSVLQVRISSNVLDKRNKEIPKIRIESFRAGCQVAKKGNCKQEVLQFETEIYRIYN